MDSRYTITVEEAARRLGIGRSLAYSLVREGSIPHLRLGYRIVIPVSALTRLLEDAQVDTEPGQVTVEA